MDARCAGAMWIVVGGGCLLAGAAAAALVLGCGEPCAVTPSTVAPTATGTGTPFEVTFDAHYDKGYIGCGPGDDFELRALEWDFDGDGSVDQSVTTARVTHTYEGPGEYTAGLRLADGTQNGNQIVTVLVRVSSDGAVTVPGLR